MKKLIIGLFVFTAIVSCKKEVVETVNEAQDAGSVYETKMAGMRVFDGVSDCSGSGGNCLNEVIIVAEKFITIQDFYSTITDPENEDDIESYVYHNYEALTVYIDNKYIDGVLNHKLTVGASKNIETENIYIKENGKNIIVYPFVKG